MAPSIQLLSSVGRDPGWQKPGHLTQAAGPAHTPAWHPTAAGTNPSPTPDAATTSSTEQSTRSTTSDAASGDRPASRTTRQANNRRRPPPWPASTTAAPAPAESRRSPLPANLPAKPAAVRPSPPARPRRTVCPQPPQQPPPGPQRLPTYQSTPPARYWAAPTLTARRAAAQPACQASASRRLTRKNGPRSAATAGYQLNAVASCLLDQGQATAVRALVLARASWR